MTDAPQDPRRAHAVEELAAANLKSNETLMHLVEKVREDTRLHERKVDLLDSGLRQTRHVLTLLAAVFFLLLALGVINTVNISAARRNAEVTAAAARDAKGTYDLLYGCLNPNGECARLNIQKQRQILDEIKLYELTALYCVRTNPQVNDPDGVEFMKCVNRLYPNGPQLKNR